MNAARSQLFDARWKIGNTKYDAIPSSCLLAVTAGHRARPGCSWAAKQKIERPNRNGGELRQMFVLELETKFARVKLDGAFHVTDLISNAVKSEDETVAFDFPRSG
jgi:hypothetical protein